MESCMKNTFNKIGLFYISADDDKLYFYKSFKNMEELERTLLKDTKFLEINKKKIKVIELRDTDYNNY